MNITTQSNDFHLRINFEAATVEKEFTNDIYTFTFTLESLNFVQNRSLAQFFYEHILSFFSFARMSTDMH